MSNPIVKTPRPPRNIKHRYGLPLLDWTCVRHNMKSQILYPDLADTNMLMQAQVLGWASNLAVPTMIMTRDPSWIVPAWQSIPRYMDWVKRMMTEPTIGIFHVARTQRDLDVLRPVLDSDFPLLGLALQLFPEEPLKIPKEANFVWIGHRSSVYNTKIPIRVEWVEDIRKQCRELGIPLYVRSLGGWQPDHLPTERDWIRRDGYRMGHKSPIFDTEPSGPYPSWLLVKDKGNP